MTPSLSPLRSQTPPSSLILLLALCSLLVGSLVARGQRLVTEHRGRNYHFRMTWQGIPRTWIVHLPEANTGRRALPVVFMFHGFGGTASWSLQATGWAEKADQEDFIAVFPEGSLPHADKPYDPITNCPSWNDGSGRFSSCWDNIDDVGFTLHILDDLQARYNVDRNRIYAVGFSNGASLAYRLGVEAPDRFAALGIVSASGIRVPTRPLTHPVSVIQIHGDADLMSPIAGGDIPQFGIIDRRVPVIDAARTWASLLHLPPAATESDPTPRMHLWQFGPNSAGDEVRYLQLSGVGHAYLRSRTIRSLGQPRHDQFDATDTIWDFLKTHPSPPTP